MTSTPDLSTSMVPRRQPQASEVLEPGPILSAVTNPETLNPKGVLPIGQGFGVVSYHDNKEPYGTVLLNVRASRLEGMGCRRSWRLQRLNVSGVLRA